jgi:hypothetical protein
MLVIVPLELLGTEQRVDQISEQSQRHDPGNDVIHESLLELVAGLGEGPAQK